MSGQRKSCNGTGFSVPCLPGLISGSHFMIVHNLKTSDGTKISKTSLHRARINELRTVSHQFYKPLTLPVQVRKCLKLTCESNTSEEPQGDRMY